MEPDIESLREEWKALAEADTLHMLPVEALTASIRQLARQLLEYTESLVA